MNSTVRCLALLALLAMAVFAAVKEEVVNENPRAPGKCFDSKRNASYAIGQKWHRVKEPCVQFACEAHKDRGKFLIKATSCDTVRPKPPCTVQEGNRRAQYPACCNSLNCPKP